MNETIWDEEHCGYMKKSELFYGNNFKLTSLFCLLKERDGKTQGLYSGR